MTEDASLTFYPVGTYMVMFYDHNHDRVLVERWNKGLAAAEDYAKQKVTSTPLFRSYTIAHVVKNSLVDKWSTLSHDRAE